MSNTWGKHFRLTTFGESHGASIGGIIDGCPAGLALNLAAVQEALDRRKPGQSKITTQRKELDEVQILSGVFEGVTTGTPIGFSIANQNQKTKDYSHLQDTFRPSHADFTYQEKYGHRDYRGGGRASARETACRVVGGAIAKQLLPQVRVQAYVSSVGLVEVTEMYHQLDLSLTESNLVRCPHPAKAEKMQEAIETCRKNGDSLGGTICCVVRGVPAGWGEPVFEKLHAQLGSAMLGINAVKGFEYGSGFAGTQMKGSEHNDIFKPGGGTEGNFSGGIQGGVSNGEDIYFKVAFKPVATIMQAQASVNEKGEAVVLEGKGRHDPCVLPRAVPIVEAMTSLVLVDAWLASRTNKI